MSILKFENRTPKTLREMYDYMTDVTKTNEEGIFGIGCNPNFVVSEMEFVQKSFLREKILHPYLQVIFAFDVGIRTPLNSLREICIKIGELLSQNQYQVFGAIHYLDTDKIHCHFMINYISINGELYRQKESLFSYKKKVNEILQAYGLNRIKSFRE